MRFFIMGGGCYGTFYARQLLRARAAGALRVDEIGVVDSAPEPAALTRLRPTPLLRHYRERWDDFLDRTLSGRDGRRSGDDGAPASVASAGDGAPSDPDDILVTPPFTPHLALAWLLRNLTGRVAGREWRLEPFASLPATPFRHQAPGGPLLLSHADWICPVNCIEPARCPRIRGPRDWDMDRTARELAGALRAAGQPVHVVELFHCHHVAYGVGGYPLARLPAAADAIGRAAARPGGMRALVGTISHCHGALNLLTASTGMEREAGCMTSPANPDTPNAGDRVP